MNAWLHSTPPPPFHLLLYGIDLGRLLRCLRQHGSTAVHVGTAGHTHVLPEQGVDLQVQVTRMFSLSRVWTYRWESHAVDLEGCQVARTCCLSARRDQGWPRVTRHMLSCVTMCGQEGLNYVYCAKEGLD